MILVFLSLLALHPGAGGCRVADSRCKRRHSGALLRNSSCFGCVSFVFFFFFSETEVAQTRARMRAVLPTVILMVVLQDRTHIEAAGAVCDGRSCVGALGHREVVR